MTLQQIKSFIAVVDSGSFNKAEDTTFLTKQALRKQVDSLETELDFPLISRNTKGIQLTEAGKVFYDSMQEGLPQLAQLIQDCQAISRRKNQLRIGNPPHPRLLLENFYNEFSRRYPDISLEIVTCRHQVVNKVLNKEVDVAEFVYRPSTIPEELSFQNICMTQYYCVVANTNPLANQESIRPNDLLPYPVGLATKSNIELYHYLRESLPEISIQDMPDSVMDGIMTLCYNQGIYISKAYFTKLLSPLVAIPLNSDITFQCGVIYRRDSAAKDPNSSLAKFLSLLKESCSIK